jgi:hypothetical protein
MLSICPTHLILLNFIIRIVFGMNHKASHYVIFPLVALFSLHKLKYFPQYLVLESDLRCLRSLRQ